MAPSIPSSGAAVYYTVNTVAATSGLDRNRLYIGIITQPPSDPVDLDGKNEERYNHRKANRIVFCHARSDQKHRLKWQLHRRITRQGKAELKRERARNKIRHTNAG